MNGWTRRQLDALNVVQRERSAVKETGRAYFVVHRESEVGTKIMDGATVENEFPDFESECFAGPEAAFRRCFGFNLIPVFAERTEKTVQEGANRGHRLWSIRGLR